MEFGDDEDALPRVEQTPNMGDEFDAPLTMPGIGIEEPPLADTYVSGTYDGLADDADADPLAAGGDFDDFTPPSADAKGYGHDVPYDFPGEPESPMLNRSSTSVGLGASSGVGDEEIDIDTHGLIDETMQRLSFVHGVFGVLIVDKDGLIVRATMPLEEAAKLAGPTLSLLQRAKSCAAVHEGDELQMLCVRTRKYELLMCLEASGAFAICVLQDPSPEKVTDATDAPVTSAARSVLRAAAGTVL